MELLEIHWKKYKIKMELSVLFVHITPYRDPSGEITHIMVMEMSTDITDQVKILYSNWLSPKIKENQ
jgi:hypothetical protein